LKARRPAHPVTPSVWQKMDNLEDKKVDENGDRWTKVYLGGGAHFRNWLSQFVELKGEENVKVEEVDSRGFKCYEESGENMYRIWVKDANVAESNEQM